MRKAVVYRLNKRKEIVYKKQMTNAALATADKLIVDYLKDFDHILLKYGNEIIEIKKGTRAINELSYSFYADSKKELEKLVDKAIKISQTTKAKGFKNYFSSITPRFMQIRELSEPLKLMFGGGFSNDIRKIIEQQRLKEGFDLSKSLWKYTKDGQKTIWNTVYNGLQNNKLLSEVRKDLEKFLTAEGKQNLNYNIKRLYVTETNNAYMRAQEYLTKTTDFVKEVHIFRSPNGDPDCEICNEIVGPIGGAGITMDKNAAELPSYHPHCMCDYVDVLPTEENFKDYLNNLGG